MMSPLAARQPSDLIEGLAGLLGGSVFKDVQALADIGDVLKCAGFLVVGELDDVPCGDQYDFIDFAKRDAMGVSVHQMHQGL